MHIGIIGAGKVGQTLGQGFVAAGHTVSYGVRDPKAEKYTDLAGATTVAQAAAHSDVILLSTPWAAAEDALAAAGDLAGKPLLDATNPIGPGFVLTHGHTDSGAEQVQRWAPGARVVKIFNSTGRENMAEPGYPTGAAAMFLCGDDPEANALAAGLAQDLGFDPVTVGGLAKARLLEPLAMLWISTSMTLKRRDIALQLMRRG